ncbi:MAG TPA: aspartate/glutamate racemase family protein [Bryobacteraceae bacterium]|nr:aspartate/glutamate racemase family protein [Bryobacteraceae bacterium]
MPASQSALASPGLEAPVRRFEKYEAAVEAMAGYEAALRDSALVRRSNGLTVTDQDQPEEVFCLFPAHPLQPPLAIIGGLGPLAGAMAFRQACARFRNSRAVVLYQACSLPDRSAVILGPDSGLSRELASRLAGAVRLAVDLAGPAGEPARCFIACNSAHYFWPLLKYDLHQPERECQVQMISLVDSTLEALRFQPCRKALVLTAEGARLGQVFSAPFREAGVAFEEPPPNSCGLLMRAIVEGVKALDDRRAVDLGNEFFETIPRNGSDCDCVLAGCTELPLIIDLLRLRGSPRVAAFLSRVRIVDPLEEALCRA